MNHQPHRIVASPLIAITLLTLLAGPVSAIEYTRPMAPQTDLSPYSPVLVASFSIESGGYLDGVDLSRRLAGAIAAEGFVKVVPGPSSTPLAVDVDPSQIAQLGQTAGAQAVLVGSAREDFDIEYGSTEVQKLHPVWHDIDDGHGKHHRERRDEYQWVTVRTQRSTARITLRGRAIDVASGAELGYQTASAERSDYWQENYGAFPRSEDSLIGDAVPTAVLALAHQFTPYKVDVKRNWRPQRNMDPLTEQATKLADSGDLAGSIPLFEQARTANPDAAWDIDGDLSIVYDALGQYDQAADVLNQGLGTPKGGTDLAQYQREIAGAYRGPQTPTAAATTPTPAAGDARKVHIVKLDGDKIFLDAGTADGWKEGEEVTVSIDEPVNDLNGGALGDYQVAVGTLTLTQCYDRFSVAKVESLQPDQQLQVGLLAEPAAVSTN